LSRGKSSLAVSVVDTLESLDKLQEEYVELFEASEDASIYSSFDFVRTAWIHYAGETDQLLLLAVRRGDQLVALAPFVIEPVPLVGQRPFRVIKFISEWGEGDRHRLLSFEDQGVVWHALHAFLDCQFLAWDALLLDEQPLDSLPLHEAGFPGPRYRIRQSHQTLSFRASLTGSWDHFIRSRKGKVRGDVARCERRLSEYAQPVVVESFERAAEINDAMERYLALERTTWKAAADFSIGGNPYQEGFYRELIGRFAARGMVAIYFMRCGSDDVAAAIIYRARGVMYGAHICYSPAYAKFSPGILLNAEIMKRHFGSIYRTFDFLALQGAAGEDRFRENWCTETQPVARITVYKRGPRYLYVLLQRLVHRTQSVLRIRLRRGTGPSGPVIPVPGNRLCPAVSE
jgi:CelD/BcsL family acetyltransferase involved in cellulose biosynthesis